MPIDRNDYTDPSQATPGKRVIQYPTPHISDLIVSEQIDIRPENYEPLPVGTPHPTNLETGFDLRLVWQGPASGNDAWKSVRRIYASSRGSQNAYNYSETYSEDAKAYPIFHRGYIMLRADYQTLEDGGNIARGQPLKAVVAAEITAQGTGYTAATTITPSAGNATFLPIIYQGKIVGIQIVSEGDNYTSTPTLVITDAGGGSGATAIARIQPQSAVLVKEELQRLDDQTLNSLFVSVSRVYETLPGPWVDSTRIDEDGMTVTITTRRNIDASITTSQTLGGGNLTTKTKGQGGSDFVGEEIWESRPIPGNVVWTYQRDDAGEILTATKSQFVATASMTLPASGSSITVTNPDGSTSSGYVVGSRTTAVAGTVVSRLEIVCTLGPATADNQKHFGYVIDYPYGAGSDDFPRVTWKIKMLESSYAGLVFSEACLIVGFTVSQFPGITLADERFEMPSTGITGTLSLVYEVLPGPAISVDVTNDRGDIETRLEQDVPYGTAPDADGLYVTLAEIKQVNRFKSKRLYNTVVEYTALAISIEPDEYGNIKIVFDNIVAPDETPINDAYTHTEIKQFSKTKAKLIQTLITPIDGVAIEIHNIDRNVPGSRAQKEFYYVDASTTIPDDAAGTSGSWITYERRRDPTNYLRQIEIKTTYFKPDSFTLNRIISFTFPRIFPPYAPDGVSPTFFFVDSLVFSYDRKPRSKLTTSRITVDFGAQTEVLPAVMNKQSWTFPRFELSETLSDAGTYAGTIDGTSFSADIPESDPTATEYLASWVGVWKIVGGSSEPWIGNIFRTETVKVKME